MHFLYGLVSVSLLSAAALAIPIDDGSVDVQKANEYKSNDCSGEINYGHHSPFLDDVTMDDTSNSVYLGNGNGACWIGFTEKTSDGGHCDGEDLGILPDKCNALNRADGKRISCVRWNESFQRPCFVGIV